MNTDLIFQFPIDRKLVSYKCWKVSLFQEWLHHWAVFCILNNTVLPLEKKGLATPTTERNCWALSEMKKIMKNIKSRLLFPRCFLLPSLCFIKVTGKTCIALHRDRLFRSTNTLTVISCKTFKSLCCFLHLWDVQVSNIHLWAQKCGFRVLPAWWRSSLAGTSSHTCIPPCLVSGEAPASSGTGFYSGHLW